MIINHNIAALNTHRQLSANTANTNKNIEKLSSGLRINRAGDDAAGLAISEKMRGQIRGLDQASRNAQDGISLIQTAEGALNETHSILQRQREIANQSANGTNTDSDRQALQDEMNQLTSEINRIGNTTEFNTQKLLQGDGKTNLVASGIVNGAKLTNGDDKITAEATQTTTLELADPATDAVAAGDKIEFTLSGQTLTLNFTAKDSNGVGNDGLAYNVTDTSASVAVNEVVGDINTSAAGAREALQKMIDSNDVLKGNYIVSGANGDITVTAVKGGAFEGAAGSIDASAVTGTSLGQGTTGVADTGTTTAAEKATADIDFASVTTDASLKGLVGKGFTIGNQQVEFYNASEGSYTGKGIGVAIDTALAATADKDQALAKAIADTVASKIEGVTVTAAAGASAITVTAVKGGKDGNNIEFKDGGVQKNFETSFQIGANTGQSMSLSIGDMRSSALGITGKAGDAGFTKENTVTDGTNDVKGEAALNISTKEGAAAAIAVLDKATATVSSERSKLGAVQNRLEHTINNLGTASENLTAAESRIRDVDMAKEMMQQTKNNILAQAAQAMLAQANQQPQGVLQLLR
ncbi:flagellin protein [Paenibacillus sp. ACRSA]|uniref:flagellin N-terminal helical domain-containing protein n=1 Tax=Paenibacillus sp. ACRSA TaxID=2918211 RepID=UPI001EF4455A|nr:flagellin [Paenibacillus sp. ACRSA]MCG7379572.1 flagellin protein [Paenibacillus sp. ACRSA]